MTSVHLSGYQRRDFEVSDYEMYTLDDTGLSFRGPPIKEVKDGNYFVCLGAAQTFGCFCEKPYPQLLSSRLNLPVLNLGYGGAGPEFFLKQEQLHEYINRSKFVVVQVMSGRSQSNSYYECGGLEYVTIRSNGRKMGARQAFNELFNSTPLGQFGDNRLVRKIARLKNRSQVKSLVNEIRETWVNNYISLLERCSVPVVFFWFSKREAQYAESYSSLGGLFGEYPQLVNQEMLDQVISRGPKFVKCVSRRGDPQPLFSRFTGEPVTVNPETDRFDLASQEWTHNIYYPTPEMHEDAAETLFDTCKSIV
ncbi:DUF6473 family protein [Pseudohalioglobus lutimaris]|uniref:DUF6473 family protein n=1 Tax=Pseudohalioglobus lutimaris TaxID=1737061 RepID=UPI001A9EFE45|nr:DUF6473 family protein [Pseudohalioglobus lutimaris]